MDHALSAYVIMTVSEVREGGTDVSKYVSACPWLRGHAERSGCEF